ncbi:MAG: hypothetical protein LM587_01915 [Candidatus Aenigmarchaeota archaeon]|jgi:hypothetical protein|nr:hypothetical protein [Candidatus Aenigmarchaeota archaeon]
MKGIGKEVVFTIVAVAIGLLAFFIFIHSGINPFLKKKEEADCNTQLLQACDKYLRLKSGTLFKNSISAGCQETLSNICSDFENEDCIKELCKTVGINLD